MMFGHKPLYWGHDIIIPKDILEMINQDRMIVADFATDLHQILQTLFFKWIPIALKILLNYVL